MPASSLLAAVDLGSNSFRLVIGDVESTPLGDQIRAVDQLKETVRLAAGLGEDNLLSKAAQDRALAALQRFGERLRTFPPERVRAVATNTFRVAADARVFLERAQGALGFPIEVIAGREEARLIYLGAAHALPADGRTRLVVDIGGGSTECIVGTDYRAELLESVTLGCVSLTRRFFPDGAVDRASFDAARLACRDALSPLSRRYREAGWQQAIGTSGTAKSLCQLALANFGDTELTEDGLAALATALCKAGSADRVRLEGLKPDRRPVLPGGLAMMSAVFEEFGIGSMDYCDGALREGVLYDLLGRSSGADMRDVTVARMLRRHGLDERHGRAVALLATALYREAAREPEDVVARGARLLGWAAQLRETGLSIAQPDFHKHGAYILGHCDMPGFSEHEQATIAAMVLGQTGGLTKLHGSVDTQDDWLRVLCLRLAVIFHRRRDGQLPPWIKLRMKGAGARLELPGDWARAHPLTDHSLQLECAEWAKAGPWTLVYQLG
ncbi:MAG TPA: exopolyphosphatase [Burkholderiaceae bacterium]|nr:exopolyphosphatase [Burkholderiaceae bacterium]